MSFERYIIRSEMLRGSREKACKQKLRQLPFLGLQSKCGNESYTIRIVRISSILWDNCVDAWGTSEILCLTPFSITVMNKNNENHVFSLSFLNRPSPTFLYYTGLDRNDTIHILEKRQSESVNFSQS